MKNKDKSLITLTVSEAGARGGTATVLKHGIEHLQRIGKIGGQSTVRLYGAEQMRRWGRLGGRPVKRRLVSMEGEETIGKEVSGGWPSRHVPPPLRKR